MVGQTLAHYEIVEKIGEGGMGEVYRARDTKLGREVAIKVLPDDVATRQERLDRFEREARLLARINHPNIATLHGLEEDGGQRFLVMELVEGETLAERIGRGPLATDDVISLFIQIARGLEAAHTEAIVHRDLKPANVKVGPADQVKILDFGLAKALAHHLGPQDDASESETVTRDTALGVILGTAMYMSPEQARGLPVDKRTDIWAFGCCLYEALSGQPAFAGATVSDIIGRVLERDPDWDRLPQNENLKRLVCRCLQKDSDRRLHDIADARVELEESRPTASSLGPDSPTRTGESRATRAWGFAVAGCLVGGLIAASFFSSGGSESATAALGRFEIVLPEGAPLAVTEQPPFAVSPDGRLFVYIADEGDANRMYQRRFDESKATPIPDTEGAHGPFFSPDGESVGFFSGMEIRRVSIDGGASQLVTSGSPVTRGAHWTPSGEIVLTATNAHGVARGFLDRGFYSMVVTPDPQLNERNLSWSDRLPDGRVLVTVHRLGRDTYESADIAVLDLETGTRTILVEGGYHARYVPTGHVVYMSRGALTAVPFSLSRLEVTGSPVRIVEGVVSDLRTGAAYYSLSHTGTLIYAAGDPVRSSQKQLVWVDRDGRVEPLLDETQVYNSPRLSPDGARVAVGIEGANDDLWMIDVRSGGFERLTFEARNLGPVWTPDGARLTFSSTFTGDMPQLMVRPTDGKATLDRLVHSRCASFAGSWSLDGQTLAYTCTAAQRDVVLASFGDEPVSRLLLESRFDEFSASFSPDGRWLAYVSNESGRNEVYARFLSDAGARFQLSAGGGTEPIWSRSGGEVFYRSDEGMVSVALVFSAPQELEIERRSVLFEDRFEKSVVLGLANYDVSSAGRFLMVQPKEAQGPSHLNVVLNWHEELERLAPSQE